jgi:hypothetical protein
LDKLAESAKKRELGRGYQPFEEFKPRSKKTSGFSEYCKCHIQKSGNMEVTTAKEQLELYKLVGRESLFNEV